MSFLRRRLALRAVPLAVAAALLVAAPAGATSIGQWKVFVTADYHSTGTETDAHCYPGQATSPSSLTATATQHVTIRTAVPATVDMYEAPNGIGVVTDDALGPAFKGRVAETRGGTVGAAGLPAGCIGAEPNPKPDCGSRSLAVGAYFNPLGKIHGWEGFSFEPRETPRPFSTCGLTAAQGELPGGFEVDVKAPPRKLSGHAPKLVFHRTERFKASGRDEGVPSTATAVLTWTVKLVRASR